MKIKVCSVENCNREARAKKLCRSHYYRLKNTGSLYNKSGNLELDKPRNLKHIGCKIDNCNKDLYSQGYCEIHMRRKKAGTDINRPLYAHDRKYLMPEICIIENCNTKSHEKGYCSKHMYRIKNNLPMDNIDLRKGENNRNWNGGNSEYPNHWEMKQNRKIVLSKYKTCQKCGNAPAVMVHHIDLSNDNHLVENLMAVCCKCNANMRHKLKNNSKYRRLYGYTLEELCTIYNTKTYNIYKMIKNDAILL